jgi:hemoglobin-like flavoprotein
MMTTPDQNEIALVQASFAKVVPVGEQVAQRFYARLFELAPEVKPLFKNDLHAQGRKLMTTLALITGTLRCIDTVLPAIKLLAVNHVKYGVRPAHYRVVGEALLWTLEQALGPDEFSPETKAAWASTYALLSDTMIAAAYGEQAAA